MAEQHADLVVVGGGAMGLATAWSAATASDARVVVLERFGAAHHRGASHGTERIFRHAHVDADYVAMALAAEEAWTRIEHEIGRTLIHRDGFVEHGDLDEMAVLERVGSAQGLATERLSPDEAVRRWPGMRFATDVLYQPEAGWIRAAEGLEELTRLVTAAGADLRYDTPVASVEVIDAGGASAAVEVRAGDDVFVAPAAVITAGAWTTTLVRGVELPPLTTTEEHVFFLESRTPEALPPAFLHSGLDPVRYGLPAANGLVKVGEHHSGDVTTGDDRTFVTTPERVERIVEYVSEWHPGLVPEVLDTTTCLYTSTPDHMFALTRSGPVVVGAGFSGIGFKYVPEVGRRLAELALHGNS
jgi:sarcosine oxidase